MAFCPQCGNTVHEAARYCIRCGAALAAQGSASSPAPDATATTPSAQGAASPQPPYPYATTPAPPQPILPHPGEAPSEGVAIAALLLNILILPGLGSLIAGRKEGWAQLGLVLGGFVLLIVLVGIFLLIAAWVWGIVSGVQAIQDAQAAASARARGA